MTYEGRRQERRVLNGTLELNNSGWTMKGGPPDITVVVSADDFRERAAVLCAHAPGLSPGADLEVCAPFAEAIPRR